MNLRSILLGALFMGGTGALTILLVSFVVWSTVPLTAMAGRLVISFAIIGAIFGATMGDPF